MSRDGRRGRPRVLHVVDSLHTGGLERLLEMLIGHSSEAVEHRVCVLRAVGEIGERLRTTGTPVDLLGRAEGADRTVVPRLAWRIAAQRPDVVHAHSDGASDALPAARLAMVGRTVFTEHGWLAAQIPRRRRWSRRVLLKAARAVVAVSEFFARQLHRELWVPAERIRVIRNAVPEMQAFAEAERMQRRAALGIDEKSFVVGSVGALRPVKRWPRLVEALSRIARQRGEVVLLIVGDGPERRNIEAEIRRHDLSGRVLLVGHQERVRDYLAAMDLFALPSDMEGTSLALLEASWCGLPAVATAVGGNPEVIDNGVSGRLVDRDDVAALAAAISSYASDRRLANLHGQRARARVQRLYSWNALVDDHLALYHEMART